MRIYQYIFVSFFVLTLSVQTKPLLADTSKIDDSSQTRVSEGKDEDIDTHKLKALKDAGKIMSLEEIIRKVKQDYPGRIIEIELEDDDDRYIYELELVDENNIVWEIEVDAASGQVLKHEQDD